MAWWPSKPVCADPTAANATLRLRAWLADAASNDAGDLREGLRVVGNESTQAETLGGSGLAVFGSLVKAVGVAKVVIRCVGPTGLESENTAEVDLHVRGETATR